MAFPRRRPHVASPDEVRITREGNAAIIEYGDPNIATTHSTIGAEKLATSVDRCSPPTGPIRHLLCGES